ncbi:MAG: glycosyl transferase [Candidatus Woesebacteria bacterium GW2011_GWC1_38_13]|uniref:Glycosyl transferase n=1 Tax=Candidatus Woesebacteria bacterium GW2011_GWC1_38_13 TaxID=1618583 RepID=A0A0G0IWJ1_9BACT|nr:MAG: glycosyl transferase [Candidatus Woesebacteria bacterium GW2011_GWC1_38_13]
MISVSIITLNEEKYLEKCLQSVKGIADEIVVVDSGSTDKTLDIAKKFSAKVYFRKFDNYANQKNYAVEKCTGDWILSMDGDEEIEDDLLKEVKSEILNPKSEINGYSIPRKNIIFGKFIRYTRWQPELDRHIWLWKKDLGKWMGDVHEEVVVEGRVGKLKHAKIHHQYETVRDFFEMMNRYSEIDASERVKNGRKYSHFRFLFDPIYNFLVRYFYRLGFLDGWRGFVLSYLMAVYHLIVWVKVGENKIRNSNIEIRNNN